ncbi:MAG: DUF4332 domain-containing protein [Planctomycetales bacterium]|nr:DUF4332 domain-containing protein [Planctomycetales bacterium]
MRISQMSLEGRGAWPDLYLDALSPKLNVFFAAPRGGKSTLAQLVSHLLYGKPDSSWRLQFGQSVPLAEGSVSINAQSGRFVLRRHCDANRQSKLTIASADGKPVGDQTVRNLLSDLEPSLASQLYTVDFAESPAVECLLSENFSRQFMATSSHATSDVATQRFCCQTADITSIVERVDRNRIDELVRRRDAIAEEIEQRLALRRREGGVLEHELGNIDAELAEKRQRSKELQVQLRSVETELAEIEARLRYFALESIVQHPADEHGVEQTESQREALDAEISRCRQSLNDLQAREAVVRTELARSSPDGTADVVTCLADGRTTLSVMERLLDDLDAEISQLARANEPGRCYSADAHAKLSPVAEILRQQVYTLCGQLAEQERSVRRQRALAETRQLARSQAVLGERLEQLLSQRESLLQVSRQSGRSVALSPMPPVFEHCRCDRHGQFVADSSSYRIGSPGRPRLESELRQRRAAKERDRIELVDAVNSLQGVIKRLETRWKDLQSQRSSLLGRATLEDQQTELERLEKIINDSLQPAAEAVEKSSCGVWRASDVLAQLTDGQLVQIHLVRQGRRATVTDRNKRTLEIESLTPAQHDAIYLALTLALVASYARRGISLPLILDEPFLRQESAGAAAMAGVIEEFARSGHQVLVFTEDRDAERRFGSLGSQVFDLDALRDKRVSAPPRAAAVQQVTTITNRTKTTTNTHVVRKSSNGHFEAAVRLSPIVSDDQQDVFYLSESSPLSEFPVLGEETGAVFAKLGFHTVGEVLWADATEVAAKLARKEIRPRTVSLWQSHMGLMCFVPELTLNDAQLLTACDIDDLDELVELDVDQLLQQVEAFLDTDRGRRFASSRRSYSRSRVGSWLSGARRNRDRWNRARTRYSWPRSRHTSRLSNSTSRRHNDHDQKAREKSTSSDDSSRSNQARKQRFYLQRSSPVEEAPSIGPKTADRLAKVGIRTVADLLNADPEATAEELGVRHINAATIAAWQQQSRLVCRIPQLRGFGAQLLVACGFTEPEQISSSDAESVASKLEAFAETKQGQRILRNGDPPSRETIDQWIRCASRTRPLEAA